MEEGGAMARSLGRKRKAEVVAIPVVVVTLHIVETSTGKSAVAQTLIKDRGWLERVSGLKERGRAFVVSVVDERCRN